jgi:hypothetical protein
MTSTEASSVLHYRAKLGLDLKACPIGEKPDDLNGPDGHFGYFRQKRDE